MSDDTYSIIQRAPLRVCDESYDAARPMEARTFVGADPTDSPRLPECCLNIDNTLRALAGDKRPCSPVECGEPYIPRGLGAPKFDLDTFESNVIQGYGPILNLPCVPTPQYAYAIAMNGAVVRKGSRGWARMQCVDSPEIVLTSKTRLQTASFSKLITAIGVIRALQDHGLDLDSLVAPYLPHWWSLSFGVKHKLTFRRLLTYRSGFGGADDIATLRSLCEGSIPPFAPKTYNNPDIGIFRIILPMLTNPYAFWQIGHDNILNKVAAWHYMTYINSRVLVPSGVSWASANDLEYVDAPTLSYNWGNITPGFRFGDLTDLVGGGGWFLSVEEMLKVLVAARTFVTIQPGEGWAGLFTETGNDLIAWNPPLVPGVYGLRYRQKFAQLTWPSGAWISGAALDYNYRGIQAVLFSNMNGVGPAPATLLVNAFNNAWI